MEELNQIQREIKKAMEQLSQKALYTEAVLAKKIRENVRINTKKKAGIAMKDLETVLEIFDKENIFYELHLNSANDLLIKKSEEMKFLEGEVRHRRQSREKSMSILTNGDFKDGIGKGKPKQKRTERKSMNIYGDYDD